jgi:CheY-like chemotaxis protein
MVMPKMDGLQFLSALRADPELQSIPVILLSVRTPWLQLEDYSRWDIQGAIAKPFNSVELPEQIAAILGWNFSANV